MDINELADQYKKAGEKFEAMRLKWESRRRELEEQARKQLSAELGDEYKKVQAEKIRAHDEWQKELDRLNLEKAQENAPFATGTRMRKWTYRNRWTADQDSYIQSDVIGVFQVFRRGDEAPQNQRWSRPSCGDFIVRFLKKDGNPGSKFERYDSRTWIPEGQPHPENKRSEKQ